MKFFKIFANPNYRGCRDGQCGHFGVLEMALGQKIAS